MNKIYQLTSKFVFITAIILFLGIFVNKSVFAETYNECTSRVIANWSGPGAIPEDMIYNACGCLSDAPQSIKDSYCTVQISQPAGALTQIEPIISGAIQLILIIAGLITFVYLLLGGIKWITSGGDKGKVEEARNQIIQALIGLIVVLAAWGIIVLFERMTGVCLGFTCPLQLPTLY